MNHPEITASAAAESSRRRFLKGCVSAVGAAVAAGTVSTTVEARDTYQRPPEALGLLYDATLCIGCKACVAACKRANDNPPEFSTTDKLWDTPLDTSGYTFNIISTIHRPARSANANSADIATRMVTTLRAPRSAQPAQPSTVEPATCWPKPNAVWPCSRAV